MNGRIYDYNLGRFLSVDPFIQAPGNSQSMNPYSYIMNNPLSGTDPSGYASCGAGGSGVCKETSTNVTVKVTTRTRKAGSRIVRKTTTTETVSVTLIDKGSGGFDILISSDNGAASMAVGDAVEGALNKGFASTDI